MPSKILIVDEGREIFTSLVNHTPYLLVHPHELEEYKREFPGIIVRTHESVPFELDALRREPRNRHERRKAKKLGSAYAV